ncbi:DinB family protein [Priestia taiwanensis]|uniref:DinB-like domain-containing protein n=1 Tax=Priestia taiwanensis TaxID=1347902 RepID=A0A917AMM6_9BACI|nr:DinB family protein [Priestia taiwanensis]MBM7362021.1 hypothetical protein [Priestia taiwanensis]GGE58815.1 hypothetical protein GCM10007140_06460 [Priestia taiwanensis]
MQRVISNLNEWIYIVEQECMYMFEEDVSKRPALNKWSQKEVLGHLCDSAVNNLTRFIKIQYEAQPFILTTYKQEEWVDLQGYEDMPIEEIVQLWCSLNRKIVRAIGKIPSEKLAYQSVTSDGELVTLEWLIEDYVAHMEQHLKKQIFICS